MPVFTRTQHGGPGGLVLGYCGRRDVARVPPLKRVPYCMYTPDVPACRNTLPVPVITDPSSSPPDDVMLAASPRSNSTRTLQRTWWYAFLPRAGRVVQVRGDDHGRGNGTNVRCR
jgi:hypothetical protein